jgi:putative hydrolase
VAGQAMRFGVPICINTDAHSPSDLITKDFAGKILLAAGVDTSRIESVFGHSKAIVEKTRRRD